MEKLRAKYMKITEGNQAEDVFYQHVYQGEPTGDVNNIIYCLIRSLRKKLETGPRYPKYIHTVKGVRYKFEPLSEG